MTIITKILSLSLFSPDCSKSSRQGKHCHGVDEPTERADRGDSGENAKHGAGTIGIGGQGSKDGGRVDRLRAGEGTFAQGQANCKCRLDRSIFLRDIPPLFIPPRGATFQFVTFLDRLGKAMQMDEISEEMGIDLQTESLLVRAEQLARLEGDKLVDKVYITRRGDRSRANGSLQRLVRIQTFSNVLSLSLCVCACFRAATTFPPARSSTRAATTTPPCRGFGASDPSTSLFLP